MNINKRQFLKVLAGMTGTATAVATLKIFDNPASAQNGVLADIPDGYTGFLTYIANGYVAPGEDFIFGLPAINFFHKGVMKLTDAGIEDYRQRAIDFFSQRFGINIQNTIDYQFNAFAINPKVNYRAYVVGGKKVPKEGWVIRDGGWAVIVTNPSGVTLGGEFAGKEVPAGTAFLFGDYNILTTDRGPGGKFQEIIISYKAGSPVIPLSDGSMSFRCDIESVDYGIGKAQGISAPVPQSNGLLRMNIRNVVTFSTDNGL